MSELRERTTVLLVDDRTEHRVAMRKVLAPAYEVIEAADGNEALQMTEPNLHSWQSFFWMKIPGSTAWMYCGS